MDSGPLIINEEILERVVYGMENQKTRLFMDPANGNLRPESENDGTFIPMPSWGPTDGYRLMSGFTATLPDSVLRERLAEILQSGSGVFRHYKDALKERPEIERIWRQYKKREMRKAAVSWLSRWNEALELDSLAPEPEDLDDLVLADFAFREAQPREIEAILKLERSNKGSSNNLSPDDSGIDLSLITAAENPSGDLVGYSGVLINADAGSGSCRLHVYVLPDFRGLGIGRRLISITIAKAEVSGVRSIRLHTGKTGRTLEDYMKSAGFKPAVTIWEKTV
jgi:GNAT superfamily N-acetyltransferase